MEKRAVQGRMWAMTSDEFILVLEFMDVDTLTTVAAIARAWRSAARELRESRHVLYAPSLIRDEMHALALRAALLPATDSIWWWLDIQGNAPGAIEDRCLVADVVTERLRELEQRYGEVKDVACFWCDESTASARPH